MDVNPTEGLTVVGEADEQLRKLKANIDDVLLATDHMAKQWAVATARIEQLERENLRQEHALLGMEARLKNERGEIRDQYAQELSQAQTEVVQLRLAVEEVRQAEAWAVNRFSDALGIRSSNLRELIEKVIVLVTEAKAMVRENLSPHS